MDTYINSGRYIFCGCITIHVGNIMRIHSTAKFEGMQLSFHDSFKIATPEQHINELTNNIVNIALQKIKVKCENYFRVKYTDMISFECYYYNSKGEEINIFKKEKGK